MKRQITIILLGLFLFTGGCSSANGNSTGEEMSLEKYEGIMQVNDKGKDIEAFAGMNLYDGYGLRTEEESYGWILLDQAKLLKMDEETDASIRKDGKKLKIGVSSGELFFCVKEPLSNGESLEFETSNMTLAIRGTTGIVKAFSKNLSAIVLIEGQAQITASQETITLKSGQCAQISTDPQGKTSITVSDIAIGGDVDGFALAEIENDPDVAKKIADAGVQAEYLNKEEMRTVLSKFSGFWKGDVPHFSLIDTSIAEESIDFSIEEDIVYIQPSQELVSAVEAYNASGPEFIVAVPPIIPPCPFERIRIIDRNTITVYNETITISQDGNSIEWEDRLLTR